MRIAVVAWGSLVWNRGILLLTEDWRPEGPVLPIEFSRVSDNGRLTLVIDETHGANVQSFFATSALEDLSLAVANLMEREHIQNVDRVGVYISYSNSFSARAKKVHPSACEAIASWSRTRGLDAVIWTALAPRFKEKTGETFSPESAIRYLRTLDGATREDALQYIREAPSQVQTPVRDLAGVLLG